MKKERLEILEDVFKLSRSGIFKWRKENRPIIEIIEKYFTNEELKEFLETGRIESKEENLKGNIEAYIDRKLENMRKNIKDELIEELNLEYLKKQLKR